MASRKARLARRVRAFSVMGLQKRTLIAYIQTYYPYQEPLFGTSGVRPHSKHHAHARISLPEFLRHCSECLFFAFNSRPVSECGCSFPVVACCRVFFSVFRQIVKFECKGARFQCLQFLIKERLLSSCGLVGPPLILDLLCRFSLKIELWIPWPYQSQGSTLVSSHLSRWLYKAVQKARPLSLSER